MKQTCTQENEELDPYENGQSDAEKLMRRHLQTPGDVITDEELKNLKTAPDNTPVETALPTSISKQDLEDREDEKAKDEEDDEEDKPITPWDVIG